MIIIRKSFSRTWENIKDPEARTKKAEELKEARKEINKRADELRGNYKRDMKEAGLGKLKNKEGKQISTKEVQSRFNNGMEELNNYRNSIQDTTHRKPKPVPPPAPIKKSGFKKTIEKGTELLKSPGAKKWGYRTIGAAGATLAVSGVDRAIKKNKEKKKENEVRKKIVGGKKK